MSETGLPLQHWLRTTDELLSTQTVTELQKDPERFDIVKEVIDELIRTAQREIDALYFYEWDSTEIAFYKELFERQWRRLEQLSSNNAFAVQESETTDECTRAMSKILVARQTYLRIYIAVLATKPVQELPGMQDLLSKEYPAHEHYHLAFGLTSRRPIGEPRSSQME